jgi:hypothetical protein
MNDQNEWNRARAQQRMDKCHIAAGVVEHPATGMWQTWISLDGTAITLVSGHYDQQVAEDVIADLKTAAQMGAVDTAADVTRRFAELHAPGDREPQPLPEATLRAIATRVQVARSSMMNEETTHERAS